MGRSELTFISQKFGQFAYFDEQLGRPSWAARKVLDFGGNAGNLLRDPRLPIPHANYWCMDVSRDAVELGRRLYPEANFIFYDRYNYEYNPGGVKGLKIPDPGHRFDYILVLSVFTHTDEREMFGLLDELRGLLGERGTLAFTFLDPRHTPRGSRSNNLRYYAEDRLDFDAGAAASALDEAERALRCTLAGSRLFVGRCAPEGFRGGARGGYLAFHTVEHIRALFPAAEIREPVEPIPRQHCCILRNDTHL